MTLLMDKCKDVYIFSSFFYTKLVACGCKGVERWAKSIDLFSKRELLFPVHHINHWCLVSVNVENCQVSLYDSLSHLNKCNSFMDAIEKYLLFKESGERVGARKWRKEICPSVPQQDNMNDCGVYVCMNARNIVEQSAFRFNLDIHMTRKHIFHELLNSKLLQF